MRILWRAGLVYGVATALAAGACGSSRSGSDGSAPGGASGGSAGRGGAIGGVGGIGGGGASTGGAGRGGAIGGVGGTGGGGASTGVDAGPPPRQIFCAGRAGIGGAPGVVVGAPALAPCAADDSCPDGQVCFRLTPELALCDIPQRTPASGCMPACEANQICREYPGAPCSVPGRPSYCADRACNSAADCADGTACTPTSFIGDYACGTGNDEYGNARCMPRVCRSDQDCTGGPNGRCVLFSRISSGGYNGVLATRLAVACVYSGSPSDPSSCAGAWSCGDSSSHLGSHHLCPNADGGVP